MHVSTDYVFDGATNQPYDEESRPNPINVYGASKLAGEQSVRALNPRHFIVRTAWLYDVGGLSFPNTLLTWAEAGGPVRVVNDQFGSPTFLSHLALAIEH